MKAIRKDKRGFPVIIVPVLSERIVAAGSADAKRRGQPDTHRRPARARAGVRSEKSGEPSARPGPDSLRFEKTRPRDMLHYLKGPQAIGARGLEGPQRSVQR